MNEFRIQLEVSKNGGTIENLPKNNNNNYIDFKNLQEIWMYETHRQTPEWSMFLHDLGQALAPSWEGYDVNLRAPWEESIESHQVRPKMGKSSPLMAELFRLVNYYNLPIYIYNYMII